MYRVHYGELHQWEKDEESADKEPNINVLNVVHSRHIIINVLVQVDVSQPASCAWNALNY